ncbi:MAG: hypothetical protein IJW19_00085 [Clostridia bacterium]|nr:hypothetical protein [Clostridia bacterium]
MAEFKESEHPRDKDGKFTDKSNKKLNRDIKLKLLKSLEFFKNRNFSNIEVDRDYPKEVYGFANNKLLTTPHHIKHQKEMGYKNSKDYEQGAINFWKNEKGVYYYSRARQRFYKYDEPTKRIMVANKNKTIHTFYIANKTDFEVTKRWDDLVEI